MKVKVLIIRFSSIGDIVLTSPAIRCLKQQLDGDVEIHFLTKKAFKSTLIANPHLSKIYPPFLPTSKMGMLVLLLEVHMLQNAYLLRK